MTFNKYPYTDFHELNLDWFLAEFKELYDAWVQFKAEMEQEIDDFETAMTNDFQDLKDDYQDFKDFVTSYLGNLDYVQAVENYIDELITNGTLVSVLTPTINNTITDWLHDNVTPVGSAVIVDASLTTSGTAADAARTGESVKNLLVDNNDNYILKFNDIITGEYYLTTNGTVASNASWNRVNGLIPFNHDAAFIYFPSDFNIPGNRINITCYDINYNYLGYIQAYRQGFFNSYATKAGTRYIGICWDDTNHANASVQLNIIHDNPHVIRPFTDVPVYNGMALAANGGYTSAANYDTYHILVKPGEKWYTNATVLYTFMCFDANDTLIAGSNTNYVSVEKHGRIYTIPANAVIAKIVVNNTTEHRGQCIMYMRLNENTKKVLCIGDSVTWLDGTPGGVYDSADLFLGYQKQLEIAGYDVTSAGFNGYAYANDGVHGSIYTEIVTNNYDVSDFDYIVLAGGLNDDLYDIPLGSRQTVYGNTTFDTSTFNGAISGIINYIRANNPTAQIIMCSPLKSESGNRPFTEAVQYVNEVKFNAEFWSCRYCNLFENMNTSPLTDNFDEYFYDSTHPNLMGMNRIGSLILNIIEELENKYNL